MSEDENDTLPAIEKAMISLDLAISTTEKLSQKLTNSSIQVEDFERAVDKYLASDAKRRMRGRILMLLTLLIVFSLGFLAGYLLYPRA